MATDEQDHNTSRAVGGSNPGKRKRSSTYTYDTWAVSEIEQETFAFLWTLKNYSVFSGAEKVRSPKFRGGPKSNHFWHLILCPKKKSEDDDLEYASIELSLRAFGDGDTSQNRKIKVRFQIAILDADGCPVQESEDTVGDVCEFGKGSCIGYDEFVLSSDLISPSHGLVNDDTLKIHCRVWIECDPKHKVCTGAAKKSLPEEELIKGQKERLANDFGKLFKDNLMTDIAVTTDSSTFMAHKAVLAARSSVFAAMFNTNMVENELNTVKISDFEDDIVKAMLEYLYTGETELLRERAPDLLQVAEKYNLPGLKGVCEYTISDNLTLENAAQVLVMAQVYNASLLKPRVIDYINCNKEYVMKTKSFQQISRAHPNLLLDLYASQ